MKSAYLPAGLSLLALALLGLSGIGVRMALWPFPTGFQMLRCAVYFGGAAALLGLIGLAIPAWRAKRAVLISSALLGLAVAALPLRMLQQAKSVPAIHDITTDTTN
ncbi:MAG: DUF1499 domain-containing protein, partial [Pseudomonadota bacterium]|nr:DUF1499 domain-containing protein [Pseudomonadota bacterium]